MRSAVPSAADSRVAPHGSGAAACCGSIPAHMRRLHDHASPPSLALMLLVLAPAALAAENDGRGWYGATNDKVVTERRLHPDRLLPDVRVRDEHDPAPAGEAQGRAQGRREAARQGRLARRLVAPPAASTSRRASRVRATARHERAREPSATRARAPRRSSRSTASTGATPWTARPPRGCTRPICASRPTRRRACWCSRAPAGCRSAPAPTSRRPRRWRAG